MSRWSREKHRRETAILQSFRDKLKYEIMKTISEKILYGDGRDNEYDDIVMKGVEMATDPEKIAEGFFRW